MATIEAALRHHLKRLIIDVCDVRGVGPEQVGDDEPLFSDDGILGLTSLDAIEIAVAIEREYKVKMKNMSSARDVFRSFSALAEHIAREADPAHLEQLLGAPE